VLRAVIIGYDVAGRLPKVLGIKNLQNVGIANHGIGSTFWGSSGGCILITIEGGKDLSHAILLLTASLGVVAMAP
jgi:hypothetical protein